MKHVVVCTGWISIAIFCAEVAVSIKYGQGEYEQKDSMRQETIYCWGASTCALLLWMLLYFPHTSPTTKLRSENRGKLLLDCLFISIPLPLLGMALKECLRTFDDFGVSLYFFNRTVHAAALSVDA
eukprot:COSAG02_NODE_749_length_17699_cov_13.252727_3_plen_126_part_00